MEKTPAVIATTMGHRGGAACSWITFGRGGGERSADHGGQGLCPKFPHNGGAMIVHGTLADFQVYGNILARCAG